MCMAVYKLISPERYTPQMIIYDCLYDFDIKENDNHQYLQYLRPINIDKDIHKIVNSGGDNENFKMLSNSYLVITIN